LLFWSAKNLAAPSLSLSLSLACRVFKIIKEREVIGISGEVTSLHQNFNLSSHSHYSYTVSFTLLGVHSLINKYSPPTSKKLIKARESRPPNQPISRFLHYYLISHDMHLDVDVFKELTCSFFRFHY